MPYRRGNERFHIGMLQVLHRFQPDEARLLSRSKQQLFRIRQLRSIVEVQLHPVRARGMGGRQVRTGHAKYGNIFDHFATELIYPNGVRVTSMCRQIDGCWGDVSEFVVGTKGGTNCRNEIYGPSAWKFSGDQVDPYVQEHIDLQASIKEGKGSLNEAKNVATSTMTAILARTACYTGKEIAWDDLVQSNERLGPEKYEFGPMAIPAIARPGNAM